MDDESTMPKTLTPALSRSTGRGSRKATSIECPAMKLHASSYVFRTLCGLTLALLCGIDCVSAAPAKRPNVIIVLSDDQGYGDFSCHGNTVLKTPNLDKLHEQSIRLTDFHVAPMCTPTRGQLMSGQDALRTGASSVCAGRSFLRRGTPMMAEI